VTALRRTGGRWLSLAATIALLLATAAAGYLAGVGVPGNDGRAPSMTGFQDATPTTDSTPAVTGSSFECAFGDGESYSSPYLPCVELQEALASTEVRGTFSAKARAASSVQMQTWTVYGGASVSFRAPTSPVAGVAVDFVLDGAYVATFDAVVTVTPAYVPQVMIPVYTPLAAGEPVELTGDDIVSYEVGTKRTVSNPLAGTPLTLKTVLIYDGDPSLGNLVEGSEGPPAFAATVDGDGKLPLTVGEYGPLGPALLLNYVRVLDDYPFSSEVGGLRVVMGPVAGSADPTEVDGWVLWASTFVATA